MTLSTFPGNRQLRVGKNWNWTENRGFLAKTKPKRPTSGHFSSGWPNRLNTSVKAQTINISPLRGDHAPEPIDMPFSVLTPVTDIIIPAKFYVDPLKGFWEGAPPKVPFPILFGTTITALVSNLVLCVLLYLRLSYMAACSPVLTVLRSIYLRLASKC